MSENATRSGRLNLLGQTASVIEYVTMGWGLRGFEVSGGGDVTVLGSVRFGAADQV